ncbi:MAG: hypothetical protein OMM_12785, partial [Candidatus Magnetoglobus multicellularis str. Araruama]
NAAPVITESSPITVTIDEDSFPTAFSLTLNATDSDSDTITWSVQSEASHGTGTVSGTGASKFIAYSPVANFNGNDTFIVQISDGLGGSDSLTVHVVIQPRNDVPVNTINPSVSGVHHYGQPLTIENGTWNDNTDLIPGTLTYTYQWQRADDASGTNAMDIGTNQTFTLTMAENLKYVRAIITATDDSEGLPLSQSTTVNTAWTFVSNDTLYFIQSSPQTVVMDEDSFPQAFSLTLNATDLDNDIITWSVQSEASHGTATAGGTGSSKTIAYTPLANFNGNDTFVIQISDSLGETNTLTVNVVIDPQNDPPNNTVVPDISGIFHYGEMLTINNGNWNDNTDLSPGTITFTYEWQRADDAVGTNAIGIGINQAYTPAMADNGKYLRARITATDDGEGLPYSQCVTLNTAWTLVENADPLFTENSPQAVTMDEDSNPAAFDLTLNATDSDNDPITWTILANASQGTATVSGTGTSKAIAYTPMTNYNGSDSFEIQISDGLGGTNSLTVSITINPRNDTPNNTLTPSISG